MPSCEKFKQELIECLRESDCVMKLGKTAKECIDLKQEGVSQSCRLTQRAYFECQLNLMNPKRRMRGAYGAEKN